MTFHIFVD